MSAEGMRPRTVGEVLDAGAKLYVANARPLMIATAVIVIPAQILIGLVLLSTEPSHATVGASIFSLQLSHRHNQSASFGGTAVTEVLSLGVSALVTAALVRAISDAYLDRPVSPAASLRFAARRLPVVLGAWILKALGLVLAYILLVIPGIYLYAAWSLLIPALVIERLGPVKALGRSRRLVKGRWWPVAGVLLLSWILTAIVSEAIRALLGAIDGFSGHPALLTGVLILTLSAAVASIITLPFQAAVITVLYYDLRVRHEGFDLELLADQLGLQPGTLGGDGWQPGETVGPDSVGQPGGPPFWPPPPGWAPGR
jgi:hypothetical protein